MFPNKEKRIKQHQNASEVTTTKPCQTDPQGWLNGVF